jgi:hypothetical protein
MSPDKIANNEGIVRLLVVFHTLAYAMDRTGISQHGGGRA